MSIVSGSPPAAPASMGGLGSAVEDLSVLPEMNSLRFTGTSSLVKRMDQNSDARKFTYSVWLKRMPTGQQGNDFINFFNATQNYPYYGEYAGMSFRYNGALCVYQFDGQGGKANLNGNYSAAAAPLFRDYSAWYHVVTLYDADAGYVKMYVNGEEAGSYSYSTTAYCFLQNISEGREVWHSIGGYWHNPGTSWAHKHHYHGYMADIHLIDGQALDADSFGEWISDIWKPRPYTGNYGANGFHLDFAGENMVYDSNGKLTQVLDASSNDNHWTAH